MTGGGRHRGTAIERLERRLDRRPSLLAIVTVVLATAMISPLVWLFVEVIGLGGEAFALTVDPTTIEVLLRSIALVAVVTTGSVALGLPLAVLTARTDLPAPRVLTAIAALPLAVPSYLGALAVISACGEGGILTGVLRPVGVAEIPALTGFWGAALVLTLYTYPYVLLTTRAALLALDDSLIEAARTLDASRWAAFRRVTLPRIVPGIAAGALLVALYTLADFGTPNFLGVEVFTQFIYARHENMMRPYAALLSLQLLAVTGVILLLESRVGADDASAYARRGGRGAAGVSLGRWRWLAASAPVGVAGLAVGLPVVVFALWLSGPVSGSSGLAFELGYGWNSVWLSALAALVAIVVAVPIGVASARSGTGRLADRLSYVGYATPGIVLAIALSLATLHGLPPVLTDLVHRTAPVLVVAYVIRFGPQAVGAIRTATLQVDRRLLEAARTLGRSKIEAARAVTVPLIAPGIATGAALVFLTTMKELPATLLLKPFRMDHTLVTYIWRVREAGLYGRAALPALALVAISGLSMLVILHGEGSNT